MPYCPNCGHQVSGNSSFCTECGFKLVGESTGTVADKTQICEAIKKTCMDYCSGVKSRENPTGDFALCGYYDVYITGNIINVHIDFLVECYCFVKAKAKKLAPAFIEETVATLIRKIDMTMSTMTLDKPYEFNITLGEPKYD